MPQIGIVSMLDNQLPPRHWPRCDVTYVWLTTGDTYAIVIDHAAAVTYAAHARADEPDRDDRVGLEHPQAHALADATTVHGTSAADGLRCLRLLLVYLQPYPETGPLGCVCHPGESTTP